jgi:hypothetical protein
MKEVGSNEGVERVEMIALARRVHPAWGGLPWVVTRDGPRRCTHGLRLSHRVDYHKAYSHLVVQDTGGRTLRSGRVRNDSRSVAGFLSPFSGSAHAVLDAEDRKAMRPAALRSAPRIRHARRPLIPCASRAADTALLRAAGSPFFAATSFSTALSKHRLSEHSPRW